MHSLENTPESNWEQITPYLEEAMSGLGDRDRIAVLLRFFQRKPLREVGNALGISEDAARMRVNRAVEKLRSALAKRGLTSTSAVLGILIAERSVGAAPGGLAAQVIQQAALAGMAGSGVTGLLQQILKPKFMVGGLAIFVLMIGFLLVQFPMGRNQAKGFATNTPSKEEVGATGSMHDLSDPSKGLAPATNLILHIVAADSEKPVPNVAIDYQIRDGTNITRAQLESTRFGLCNVPWPTHAVTEMQLISQTDGFADTRLRWNFDRGETIPREYTLRLIRAVTIGGQVIGPDGEPVVGASVDFRIPQSDPAMETSTDSHRFGALLTQSGHYFAGIITKTDHSGKWAISRIAPKMLRFTIGRAYHPDFLDKILLSDEPEAEEQLLALKYVFRLGHYVRAYGEVVDPQGKPVSYAKVRAERHQPGDIASPTAATDADGSFLIERARPGTNVLVVAEASGFTSTKMQVELGTNSAPFRLILKRGNLVRLRVMDLKGQPITNAEVRLDIYDHPIPAGNRTRTTDQAGRVEWDGATEGFPGVPVAVTASGYMQVFGLLIPTDGREYDVTLPPRLLIRGTVRNIATGEPIQRFRIVAGYPATNLVSGEVGPEWSGLDRDWISFEKGVFRYAFDAPILGGVLNPSFLFRFEADGYAPFVTRIVSANEGDAQFDVFLKPAITTRITVLMPDGRVGSHLSVGLAANGRQMRLAPGGFSGPKPNHPEELLQTDDKGEFALPLDETVNRFVASCPEGYAEASRIKLSVEPIIRLKPWGRIEGAYLLNGQPARNRQLSLEWTASKLGPIMLDASNFQVEMDSEGRFTFPKVPPGRVKLIRNQTSAWTTLEVQPGETTHISLGSGTCTVTFNLRLPGGIDPRGILAAFNPVNAMATPDGREATGNCPSQTFAGRYRVSPTKGGQFVAPDVDAGSYVLNLSMFQPSVGGGQMTPVAQVPFTVPREAAPATLDLGEIVLSPKAQ